MNRNIHVSRRQAWLWAVPFLVGLCSLLVYVFATFLAKDPDRLRQGVERAYAEAWQDLDRVATQSVSALGRPPTSEAELLEAFQGMSRIAAGAELPGLSLYLLDPQGTPVVWAGAGLVHDLGSQGTLQPGRRFLTSFSSVSLLSVQPLVASDVDWHLVAGRSFSGDRLPFFTWSTASAARDLRWTVAAAGAPSAEHLMRIEVEATPMLLVQADPAASSPARRSAGRIPLRIAWLLLGLLLLTQAGLRLPGSRVEREESTAHHAKVSGSGPWLLAGLTAMMLACEAPAWSVVAAPVGWLLAMTGWGRAPLRARPRLAVLAGSGAGLLLLAAAVVLQSTGGAQEIGLGLAAGPRVLAMGWAIFSLALGLFSLTVGELKRGSTEANRWAWLALALLVVAGALVDLTWIAAIGLLVAGAATAAWCWAGFRGPGTTSLLILTLLAAMASAVSWQIAYRVCRLGELGRVELPATALPTDDELDRISAELAAFFIARNVEDFAVSEPGNLDQQDLAFEVWHRSPLASYGALSALTVASPEGWRSTFSFGLPMGEEGELDSAPSRWEDLRVPGWDEALLGGDGFLLLHGQPWARVHFWLALRPGFRLEPEGAEDLAVGLLRGGPAARGPTQERLGAAIFALYDLDGAPLATPWPESPRLDHRLLGGGRGVTTTPEGPANAVAARDARTIRALLLPRLGPFGSLEKVGLQVVDTLAVMGLLALIVAISGLRGESCDAERATPGARTRSACSWSTRCFCSYLCC